MICRHDLQPGRRPPSYRMLLEALALNPLRYDVIVVGAGHAGCEAALAAARMGLRTAMFTLDRTKIALMPCNPSVGGPGKGHLVREIDALGGEIALNTDRTSIQIRRLNTGKGPAVQARRAQCDKHAYSQSMRQTLELQTKLEIVEKSVDDLLLTSGSGATAVAGVLTAGGERFEAPAVVLTTGTFLRGRIIVGDESYPGGREGEFPADALSRSLAQAGFTLGRLKTGTPPRIHRDSIDWSKTSVQEGSDGPLFLSFAARHAYETGLAYAPDSDQPIARIGERAPPHDRPAGSGRSTSFFGTDTWRRQLNCFLVHTNERSHRVIRANLNRAPLYNGEISAPGPRYCPSIEAKIVRFADKPSHQLFLEPEGWHTDEVYVQGANTSLPPDVQLDLLHTIPALRDAHIVRAGYAIEYDYIPANQVFPTLESKAIRGLFLAGQIVGTTGYEEAAALGVMAGINAARQVSGREPVVLTRDQAYIGVLIDDLVTKDLEEPYRMHTSQAEFRLLLREDSAEARLSPVGYAIGLLAEDRYRLVESRRHLIESVLARLNEVLITPSVDTNRLLQLHGAKPLSTAMSGREALRRLDITPEILAAAGCLDPLPDDIAREVETLARYEGYVNRQLAEVRRLARMEHRVIPAEFDYRTVNGLRTESLEKLRRTRPRTIGQATRVGGVLPGDVALVLFHLEKLSRQAAVAGKP